MSGIDPFEDVLAANTDHQRTFAGRRLAGRAARGLAVVTCMDSRIDPLGMLGLVPGDAKIMRTAGARVTDDALRGLVIAHHLLGVTRVMVVAHTLCGMAGMSEAALHAAVLERSGVDTRSMEFHAFEDPHAALELDVQRVRSSPYLSPGMPVVGAVYDVRTGALSVTVG
jgi:carbonic anhydrase